jgi:hypothetical protein
MDPLAPPHIVYVVFQPFPSTGYPIIDEGQELGPGRVADRRAWATLMALVKQTSTDELLDVQHFLSNWSSE